MKGLCELAEDINRCPHYIRDKEGCEADHTSCGFFRESGKETKGKAEYMRKPRWYEQYYNR